jgi:hypothetical protein
MKNSHLFWFVAALSILSYYVHENCHSIAKWITEATCEDISLVLLFYLLISLVFHMSLFDLLDGLKYKNPFIWILLSTYVILFAKFLIHFSKWLDTKEKVI